MGGSTRVHPCFRVSWVLSYRLVDTSLTPVTVGNETHVTVKGGTRMRDVNTMLLALGFAIR